jgi:pyruvate/2-oxoglutarate/acetoin dehydrogenase E1 component
VLYFEHKVLYSKNGEVPDGEHLVPLGRGAIKRESTDVTIIANLICVHTAMQAAEALAKESIEVEVRGDQPVFSVISHGIIKIDPILEPIFKAQIRE